jgi:acetylornithine/N-succinyldiaminopimelate aminotransferase
MSSSNPQDRTPNAIDIDARTRALMPITRRPALVFVRGRGSWLADSEGRDYLDFVQGWAVNSLGHCPPEIAAALHAQANTLVNCSPAFHNLEAARYAEALALHSGMDHVFLANSGAEANEGAIKLARKWGLLHRGGAFEIITFEGAFHGRTLATMSASGKPEFAPLFEPKVPGFPKARLNDLDSVRARINPRTVAVMLEPVQGEAGVLPATDAFMRELRALTEAHGLLLIADEIQTGMGRTGTLFACEHAGIRPDIMTLAKGIGGGVPLAALLATRAASCFAPGDQGGTFNGNPLMAAVGSAVLARIAEPEFLAHVVAAGAHLTAALQALSARHGLGEVRGRGLLVALDLGRDIGAEAVELARAQGLLVNSPRPHLLRFMPALNVTFGEIDIAMRTLDQVLRHLAR